MLFIHLTKRGIVAAAVVLAMVNAGVLWGTHLARVFWRDDHWWPALYLGRQIDVARENNPAVWYASMVLFAVSLAMLACFTIDRRRSHATRQRLLTYGWLIGAAMFALLSLDEAGSLHERINSLANTVGLPGAVRVDSPGWVGVLAIPIACAGALLLAFAWFRVRRDPVAFVLMSAGTLLFLSVPVQEHLEVTRHLMTETGGAERSSVAALVEEGSELFGALCFLVATAWYACGRAREADAHHAEACRIAVPATGSTLLGAITGLGVGLLVVEVVLPELMTFEPGDGRGVPQNWFPAAMAMLVALTSLLVARQHRRTGWTGAGAAYLLLGIVHLALSMDHGSAYEFTEDLQSDFRRRRLVLDVLMAGGLTIAAVALARTSSVAGSWLVAALWLALVLLPFWTGGALRPALGLVAYAVVLPVVTAAGLERHRAGEASLGRRVRVGVPTRAAP